MIKTIKVCIENLFSTPLTNLLGLTVTYFLSFLANRVKKYLLSWKCYQNITNTWRNMVDHLY